MGLPAVAMGLHGMFMPLPVAAALLVIPSFVTNVLPFFSGPSVILIICRLWPMMLMIVAGTVAGSSLLISIILPGQLSGWALRLPLNAACALTSPALTVIPNSERGLSPLAGCIGLITDATGVFVMPPVPFLQSLRFSKDTLVQGLGLSFTVSTVALAIGLYLHHAFRMQPVSLFCMSIFPALAGMWLGQKERMRISAKRFRYYLLF